MRLVAIIAVLSWTAALPAAELPPGLRAYVLFGSVSGVGLTYRQMDALESSTMRARMRSLCAEQDDAGPGWALFAAPSGNSIKRLFGDGPLKDSLLYRINHLSGPTLCISDGREYRELPLPLNEQAIVREVERHRTIVSVEQPTPAATESPPVLVVSKGGYYVLAQDASGTPTLTRIAQVIVLDGETPTPTPQPNPTPPAIEAHRSAVRAATNKVADTNKTNVKAALAKLYQTVAGLPVTDRTQLTTSTDLLFNALQLGPQWATWKGEVDASLARFSALDDARKGWLIVAEVLGEK